MLGTFVIALFLGFSKFGKIRLGKLDKPEIGYFQWISIMMCTLLAAGGVFCAAAEPLSHFLTVLPHFPDKEAGTIGAVAPALATSFVDWGFLSWALLGTLGTIVLMYSHYHRGAPLKPRSEEHTSELQSRGHLVCRLLLEKKKTNSKENKNT